jgi:hypothetical protein
MAYDKGLVQRVRELIEEGPGCDEKKIIILYVYIHHKKLYSIN